MNSHLLKSKNIYKEESLLSLYTAIIDVIRREEDQTSSSCSLWQTPKIYLKRLDVSYSRAPFYLHFAFKRRRCLKPPHNNSQHYRHQHGWAHSDRFLGLAFDSDMLTEVYQARGNIFASLSERIFIRCG